MIYRNFQDLKLSALGFGTMRLPLAEGSDSEVDETAAAEMFDYALAHGINYFDTAWGYHNGTSELVNGNILSRYPRDSYYLASKFPGYDLANMPKAEEIFEQQLKKCRVDYFDFYLFHNVCEKNIDAYLDPQYGIYDYLMKQKENGRIRHLGFSAHGSYDVMKRFLDAYGDHMEFCQIQLNYIDWEFQDAKDKVALLREHNIPVWVMEPLRGGKLAALPEKDAARLKALRPEEDIPAWAFRFLQAIPGVTMILSGMSNRQQMEDNIRTFETDAPVNQQEFDALLSIARDITGGVPCTACRYCTGECPKELDILTLLSLYNEDNYNKGSFIVSMRLSLMPESKKPSSCIGCRSCEAVCPQQIKVSEVMSDFADKLK